MSSSDDTEVDASLPPHAVSLALTAVSTVAATFLGGGTYALGQFGRVGWTFAHVLSLDVHFSTEFLL